MDEQAQRASLLDYFTSPISGADFGDQALKTFRYQYKYNAVYRKYCNDLHIYDKDVVSMLQIPFLPITAFKHHEIKTGVWPSQETFLSSGTTQLTSRSVHHLLDLDFYHDNAEWIWNQQMGSFSDFCYLALLPGYLDRDGSSLISMVNHFVARSRYDQSGFYLRDHERLLTSLKDCQANQIPTVLFGVSYALLDFIEKYQLHFPELIVIETGGMKGQRPEMTKQALHETLVEGFGVSYITSEYGMTELLSQSYATANGIFKMHERLQVITTQINDPLTRERNKKSGIVNVIDLANIDSCAFIQTQDLGIDHGDATFSILGRLDASDVRGCNLMIDDLG